MFTAEEIAELKAEIASLRSAETQLASGQQIVKVRDSFGGEVSYTPANLSDLRRVLSERRNELARCQGTARQRAGAIGIY